MPYLREAKTVTVITVDDSPVEDLDPMLGLQAVAHLPRHSIDVDFCRVNSRDGDVGATLIAEAGDRLADLIVMGGYGHSHLREWLRRDLHQ
jgi:nucleotide-binding universal stress UspA family protein